MLEIKKKLDAVITNCGVSEKDGNPQPYVKFDVTDSIGVKHPLTWYANLRSEASTAFAVKTLVGMGFKGNDFNDLQNGVMQFEAMPLTVELEHPQNAEKVEDKAKFRIKFINAKSKPVAQFTGKMASQVALFAKVKSELGIKKTAKPATTAAPTDW